MIPDILILLLGDRWGGDVMLWGKQCCSWPVHFHLKDPKMISKKLFSTLRWITFASFLLAGVMAQAAAIPGLTGPKYFVNVELAAGGDVLPPGATSQKKKFQWDTGANATTLSRADAKMLGIVDAAGDPVAAFDLGKMVGAKNANNTSNGFQVSKDFKFSVKGRKKTGAEVGATKMAAAKKLIFPKKNGKDISSLLGTNVMSMLGMTPKLSPNGDLEFSAPVVSTKMITIDPNPGNTEDETGQPEADSTIVGPAYTVPAAVNGGAQTPFAIVMGSPYTILTQSLAASLGIVPVDTFDIFTSDFESHQILEHDGFFGDADFSPLDVGIVSILSLTAQDGSQVDVQNLPVLIGPSSMGTSVLGTSFISGLGVPIEVDVENNKINISPEPASVMLFGAGGLLLARRSQRIA